MAPAKFGLFKTRSRDQAEQPSTENLLQNSDQAVTPGSPIPSTSKGLQEENMSPLDISSLNLDSEDEEDIEHVFESLDRRNSECSRLDEVREQLDYEKLINQTSTDMTSSSTLHDVMDLIKNYEEIENTTIAIDDDSASTSFDVNSLQFDETSLTPSDDWSVNCGAGKKKKLRRKERLLRDIDMWQASNVEVMQNLLSRSGTVDEQIKWEAIATSRGLCTLTDNCTCEDCRRAKFLNGMADGDGGLGTAPLFSAISVGCVLQ